MHRWVLAGAVSMALLSPLRAAEPVLDVSSKAAYEASIVAMAGDHDPAFARQLILSLLTLARSVPPEISLPEATRAFSADSGEFLGRLEGYAGMTAEELIAAAAE